ncbi:MAG: 4Fe-4S cluster-binding domain-containing protein [Acidaminococcaceae bacterium]|jgi:putative pyruvate formate lyase activating enzyme|nr:4Fe-4S cluster-binding domain-containing protein [Acidaminococcaceae bacterium]MCI2109473.1 4Fe-4S cluster-binding domain-containing protein [Acidaminococcaceae bacterium]
MTLCNLCPRNCNVDRSEKADSSGKYGVCHSGWLPKIARAGLHYWEEPCISGTKGSGTVFFTGCNLHCVFCQNYDISFKEQGKEVSVEHLREIYHNLIAQGAHNINLVTAAHYVEAITQSLQEPLSVPVVYNSSGFEKVETLKKLAGKVQIYLPDLKYHDAKLAEKYSHAPEYFSLATAAIREMYRQVGPYKLRENGLMEKGVIIRHLIMPGCTKDSKAVIDWVAKTFRPGQVMFSLMHQYVPCGRAADYPEINRKVTKEEYGEVEDYLFNSTIEDGFVQEEDAADKEFIPSFDGTGV